MRRFIQRLRNDTEGVTALEYSMIALLIVVVIIGSVQYYVASLNNTYNRVTTSINNATGP
jgi:pilus assembly protein Flp/PilA